VCVRWTRGQPEDARDLLAEAYLRVVGNAERKHLRADDPLAWLSTIIANLARDYLRSHTRNMRNRAANDDVEMLRDPRYDADATFVTRELLAETLTRVQNLSLPQRRALLARSSGETYAAIAARLVTTPGNARKLVQTARSELRAQLSAQELTLIAGKRTHSLRRTTAALEP